MKGRQVTKQIIPADREHSDRTVDLIHQLSDHVFSAIEGCTCGTCVTANLVEKVIAVHVKDTSPKGIEANDLVDLYFKSMSFSLFGGSLPRFQQVMFFALVMKRAEQEIKNIMGQ